jgi:hypothetical protein
MLARAAVRPGKSVLRGGYMFALQRNPHQAPP